MDDYTTDIRNRVRYLAHGLFACTFERLAESPMRIDVLTWFLNNTMKGCFDPKPSTRCTYIGDVNGQQQLEDSKHMRMLRPSCD